MNSKSTQEIQALHLANAVHFQAFLLENISDAVITTDTQGIIVAWNRAAETIYGWSAEEAIGTPVMSFLRTEFGNKPSKTVIKEVFSQGRWQGEFIQYHKNGQALHIALYISKLIDAEGQPIGFMLINKDITEVKQNEQVIQESEERFRTLVENMPAGLMIFDTNAKVIFANKRASSFLGVSHDVIMAYSLRENNTSYLQADGSPLPLSEHPINRVLASGELIESFEIGIKGPHLSERIWLQENLYPVMNEQQEVQQVVMTFTDISLRKQAELKLREAHAMLEEKVKQRTEQLQNASDLLENRNLALTILHQGVLEIAAELDIPTLLYRIMQRAVELLNAFWGGGIYLYNAEENVLELLAVSGINEGRTGIRLPADAGVAGHVLQTGKPLIVNHYAEWEGRINVLMYEPSSAVMGVPLLVQGRAVGSLLVFANSQERLFNEEDVVIAEMFAAQAANALHNAQLYSAAQWELEERKKTEAALRESEERFRQIAENFDQILFLRSSDENKILYINPHYETVWGKSRESLYENADDFMEDIHPDDRKALQESMKTERYLKEGLADSEYRLMLPGKGIRWMRVRRFPIKNDEGVILRRAGIVEDVTERKIAEEALKQMLATEKELSELKTRFVSMASHEFRTPLASIFALTETLSAYRKKLSDAQVDQHLEKIKLQISRLKEIIDEVLFLAQAQARRLDFNPVMYDLDKLCRNVLDEFRSLPELKHQLDYSCDETIHEIRLDAKLMRQVISNLLSNAIKYSPKDSPIQIRLSFLEQSCILSIRDEGIGIPEADLKHLFTPFHRASNVGNISGTGLGLVIIKESVELHGGSVRVETQAGSGTNFIIQIPISLEGGSENDEDSGN